MPLRKLHLGIVAATVMFLVAGCRGVEGPVSNSFGDECQETESPATFGCVDIQGTVTNQQGQPLSGVDVALLDTQPGLGPDFVFTGQDGKFEMRLLALSNIAQATFNLRATLRQNNGVEITHIVTPVTVTVTPIGEVPEPATVNFTITGT
ncbi:MAG TPA: carboxypeptidase-like regulatory domain-containing protein [Gemmatimonadaceae bacterium]